MNLLARIKAAARSAMPGVVQPRFNNWFHRWLLPNTTIDFQRHVGDGLGSNVFLAPVLWVARAAMEARFGVVSVDDDGDSEFDGAHEVSKLLRKPNKWYSGLSMQIAIWVSWFFNGNVYLLKARNKVGEVKELWYVPHWLIEPWVDPQSNDYITEYRYWPSGTIGSTSSVGAEVLQPSEVVHIRFGLDPRNVRKGLSHMGALLREICSDDESANFVAALLLNGGVPGVIISPKDGHNVSTEDLKATKDYIKVNFSRSKRGEPMAVGAPTDIKEFGFDPKKMNLDVVRGVSEDRVCAMIGLPAAVVGFGSGMANGRVTGTTLSELHRMAWLCCVIPNQDMIAEELDRNLREDFKLADDEHLGYDRKSVRALEEDANSMSERMDRGVKSGWIMRSEAKEALGLPHDDEDEVYLVPMGTQILGPGAPEPDAQTSQDNFQLTPEVDPETQEPTGNQVCSLCAAVLPPAQAAQHAHPQPAAPAAKPPAAKPPKPAPKKSAKAARKLTARQTQVLKAMDGVKARSQVKLDARMKQFFKGLGAAAAAAFRDHAKAFAPTGSNFMGDHDRQKDAHDASQAESMFNAMNIASYQRDLKGILGTHYVSVGNDTADALVKLGIGTDLTDEAQLDLLRDGGTRAYLVDLVGPAKQKAIDVIVEGRKNGLSTQEIAAQLEEVVPAGTFNDVSTRSLLIARNETRVAQTESAVMLYENADGIDAVMVIDARLGDTDAECMSVNGEQVSFDDAKGLIADEHPNGTRDFVPVFN